MAAKAPPVSDPDLVWFLNESEGALGLRSSYGPLVDLALSGVTASGGSGGPRWLSDGLVRAAGAERNLRARLECVEPRLRAVLWLAYGPQPWPNEVRRVSIFGHWPGVLLLSATAQRCFEKAVERRAETEAEKRTSRGDRGCVLGTLLTATVDGRIVTPRDTMLDPVAAMLRRGLGEWLRSPTVSGDKVLMARLRAETRELVAEAHAAWRAMAPPREPKAKKPRERVQVEEAI